MSGIPHVEIQESVDELKSLLQEQRSARDYKRIQTLYLLKSGQCQHIQDVAEHIGHHRSCIHRWLQQYQQEGLTGLLDPGQTRGRKQRIPIEIQAKLKERLRQPRGFGSYREIQQWLAAEQGLAVEYSVVYRTVRYRLKAKLKSPRPVHPQQDPEEVDAFVYHLSEQIAQLATHFPSAERLRYWCEDESRMGLRTIVRDRITFQPPYAPQLNPIERLWRFIKDLLANRQWFDLEELRTQLEFHLRYLSPPVIQSLTGWDFILDALSVAGF